MTETKLLRHFGNGVPRISSLKFRQREQDSWMRYLLPDHPFQEKLLENAKLASRPLDLQQLLTEASGIDAPERGKINGLVGKFRGRDRQKRADTAGLKSDAQSYYHGCRINNCELRKGPTKHAAVKALKLISP